MQGRSLRLRTACPSSLDGIALTCINALLEPCWLVLVLLYWYSCTGCLASAPWLLTSLSPSRLCPSLLPGCTNSGAPRRIVSPHYIHTYLHRYIHTYIHTDHIHACMHACIHWGVLIRCHGRVWKRNSARGARQPNTLNVVGVKVGPCVLECSGRREGV